VNDHIHIGLTSLQWIRNPHQHRLTQTLQKSRYSIPCAIMLGSGVGTGQGEVSRVLGVRMA